ncbi:MAG: DUF3267 domain-containing protein [SAR324 cluster bacterium]|nr:DUF3267 domain-containing protein [SAR324 cluster bacterium]
MFIVPGFLISLCTFPGVMVHEWAHQVCCRITHTRVLSVRYFQLGNPMGYVLHEPPSNIWKHFLIGMGPLLINSGLAVTLALLIAWLQHGLLLTWLTVSLAMHAFPSTEDYLGLWAGLTAEPCPVAWIVGIPLIGVLWLLAVGSVIWLDALYAFLVLKSGTWLLTWLAIPSLLPIDSGFIELISFSVFLLLCLSLMLTNWISSRATQTESSLAPTQRQRDPATMVPCTSCGKQMPMEYDQVTFLAPLASVPTFAGMLCHDCLPGSFWKYGIQATLNWKLLIPLYLLLTPIFWLANALGFLSAWLRSPPETLRDDSPPPDSSRTPVPSRSRRKRRSRKNRQGDPRTGFPDE